jgi:hypothetical protein
MKQLLTVVGTLALALFFVGCSDEKREFLSPKQGEVVLDANTDEYSLNGKVIGKTVADEPKNEGLLIKSLSSELNALRKQTTIEKVKFHFDDNLSYNEFYRFIATEGFSGFTSMQYVIGSEYNNVYEVSLPERNSYNSTREILRLFTAKKEKKLTNEEMDKFIKESEQRAKNYINLSLSIDRRNDKFSYVFGFKGLTTFERLDDLWKFIEDVRHRRELQDKEDKDRIILVSRMYFRLKDIAPIIRKLTEFGYKINFAYSSQ